MEYTMTQLVNKLVTWIAQKPEESLLATMENLEADHNLTFVRGALKRATEEMLVSTMDGEEVKVDFETAWI